MKKGLTELVFILDRSGSMHGLEADVIGGFNRVLDEHKAMEGDALVTTVLFDHEREVIHDRAPIRAVKPMTTDDYAARGTTALLDAMGFAIHHIGSIHKYARPEDVPERTIFVITTDGLENASRAYSVEEIRAMVRERQEEYGWQFLFLAANIDAIGAAREIGIDDELYVCEFKANSKDVDCAFSALAEATSEIRLSGLPGENWKKPLRKKK